MGLMHSAHKAYAYIFPRGAWRFLRPSTLSGSQGFRRLFPTVASLLFHGGSNGISCHFGGWLETRGCRFNDLIHSRGGISSASEKLYEHPI